MPQGIVTPKTASHPTIKATGAKGFLQWLATENPRTYSRVRDQLSVLIGNGSLGAGPGSGSQQLSGLGDCGLCAVSLPTNLTCSVAPINTCSVTSYAPSSGSSSTNWLSTISTLVQGAETAITANQATQVQLQRAKAGLPPLNLSAYGVSTTPGLNLGLSSSTLGTIGIVAVLAVIGIFIAKKA